MGILTTQESAKAFSTYVALFGFALLIASAIYLKRLDSWAEQNPCSSDYVDIKDITSCTNFNTWRAAAIIGIIIGVFDVLLVPFLMCCTACFVCGCAALLCACVDWESSKSTDETPTATNNIDEPRPNNENETTTVRNSDDEPKDPVIDKLNNFNLKNLPKPIPTILNLLGWTLWVFLPLIGTILITVWLFESNAIRTQDDKLHSAALAVFVCALLNLMVYLPKFIDSVWKFVCEQICGTKSKKENVEEASRTSEESIVDRFGLEKGSVKNSEVR